MDAQGSKHGAEASEDSPAVELASHCTSPDRTVFTEPGNPEAWISTDYTVACDD